MSQQFTERENREAALRGRREAAVALAVAAVLLAVLYWWPSGEAESDPTPQEGVELPLRLADGDEEWTSPAGWTTNCEDPAVALWRVDPEPDALPLCATEAEIAELFDWIEEQP